MKNKWEKVLAALMLSSLVLSNGNTSMVYAVNHEMTENNSNDEVTENHLNYIYVESPYVETPWTQNIVVSWGDGTEAIKNMRIVVEDEEGVREEWSCSSQAESMYLFSKKYTEDATENIYKVTEIKFFQNGKEQEIRLKDCDVTAEFGVNKIYDGIEELKALDPEENQEWGNIETSVVMTEKVRSTEKASGEVVVALDPGHDDKHCGAVNVKNKLKEHELTFKIAEYTRKELETYQGVKVYMTRKDAKCPYPNSGNSAECIEQRAKAAAAEGAKIFVSFHLNDGPANASGAEIIIPNNSWKQQVSTEGKALAEKIMKELTVIGLNKRPVPIYSKDTTVGEKYEDGSISDYYSVQICNKENGIPGIIIEHAFINSESDVKNFLGTETGLEKLGLVDAKGIAEYLQLSKGESRGWVVDANGKKKYEMNGAYLVSQWKFIEGQWYYFDADGIVKTGWYKEGAKTYYMNADGVMTRGWKWIVDEWYYFNSSGYMQTGWMKQDGKTYYLNYSGVMERGWEWIGNEWYCFNSSGVLRTDWYYEGRWKYYLNADGVMTRGWKWIVDEWYYFNSSGYMQTGWLAQGNKMYYLNEAGVMARGTKVIGGKTYKFNTSGVLLTQ